MSNPRPRAGSWSRRVCAFACVAALWGCSPGHGDPSPTSDAGNDAWFVRDTQPYPGRDAFSEPIDAARDDVWPLSAAVRVVVRDATHAPVAGARVIFHDAAGIPLDDSTTDADGVVTSGRPGVAAVTVVLSMPTLDTTGTTGLWMGSGLYSIWGVVAGDTLTFEPPITERAVTLMPAEYTEITTALGGIGTAALTPSVWDSASLPGVFAYAPSSGGGYRYALVLDGASSDHVYLQSWQTEFDVLPIHVVGAPTGTTLRASASLGSDVGRLVVSPPAEPSAALDTITLARGIAASATQYLELAAVDDRGTSRREYHVAVRRPSPLPASPLDLDLSGATPIGALAIDHDTLEVSWGAPVDASLVALSLGFASTRWYVFARGPLDRIRPPSLPADLATGLPVMPGMVVAQCAVSFHGEAALADYDTFRAHPLGPFDPDGWAGASSWVWDQLF